MSEPDSSDRDVVVPVVEEQVNVDAVPVVTGGVRVVKRVETQDEVIEQQLRTSRAEVKRVKTNRVVDGPQPAQRIGDTLVIPIVSEVLVVEKRWVVTEEIRITQHDGVETAQQTVPVNYETAQVERTDETGNAVAEVPILNTRNEGRSGRSMVDRSAQTLKEATKPPLTEKRSLLNNRTALRDER